MQRLGIDPHLADRPLVEPQAPPLDRRAPARVRGAIRTAPRRERLARRRGARSSSSTALPSDTTNSLPHLDRLLDEMNEVIEERGLRRSTRASASRTCRTSSPRTRRFATRRSSTSGPRRTVLAAVAPAYGFVPHFSTSLPRGIRLQESSTVHDPTPLAPWRDSQNWHRDYHIEPTFYVITLIRDVDRRVRPAALRLGLGLAARDGGVAIPRRGTARTGSPTSSSTRSSIPPRCTF